MRHVWLVLVAGCMTPYRAGTIAAETHAEVHELGCLELGLLTGRRSEAAGPVLVIYLGNRCDHSVTVDLSALHVVGGNDRGQTSPMVAFDPDREIRPRQLDAGVSGEEWIEVHPTGPIDEVTWLDVDLGTVVPDAPLAARWVRVQIAGPA